MRLAVGLTLVMIACTAAGEEGRVDTGATIDRDGDGWADDDEVLCGTDPYLPDSTPMDTDQDGECDALDVDDDDDGVLDEFDAFPTDPTEHLDSDGDGTGDNADPDDDNDGMLDVDDDMPFNSEEFLDSDNDGIGNNADDDDDDDGVSDADDAFPTDADESEDHDGDGIGDNADADDDNDGWNDAKEIDCRTGGHDNNSVPWDPDGDGECLPWQGPPASDAWYGLPGTELSTWTVRHEHSASGSGLDPGGPHLVRETAAVVDNQGRPVIAWANFVVHFGSGPGTSWLRVVRFEDGEWRDLSPPKGMTWTSGRFQPNRRLLFTTSASGGLILAWGNDSETDGRFSTILKHTQAGWEPTEIQPPREWELWGLVETPEGIIVGVNRHDGPHQTGLARLANENWEWISGVPERISVPMLLSSNGVPVVAGYTRSDGQLGVVTLVGQSPDTQPQRLGDLPTDEQHFSAAVDGQGRPVVVYRSLTEEGAIRLSTYRLDGGVWQRLPPLDAPAGNDVPGDLKHPRVFVDLDGVVWLAWLASAPNNDDWEELWVGQLGDNGWHKTTANPVQQLPRVAPEYQYPGQALVVATDTTPTALWGTFGGLHAATLHDGAWVTTGEAPGGTGLGQSAFSSHIQIQGKRTALAWFETWGGRRSTVAYHEFSGGDVALSSRWHTLDEWASSLTIELGETTRAVAWQEVTRFPRESCSGYLCHWVTPVRHEWSEQWQEQRGETYYRALEYDPEDRSTSRGRLIADWLPRDDGSDQLLVESCDDECRPLVGPSTPWQVFVDRPVFLRISEAPNDGYLVTWQDRDDGLWSTPRDIYLLRINADDSVEELDGSASPGGFTRTPGSSNYTLFAFDTDDQPIAVWTDSTNGSVELYLKHYHQGRWLEHWGSATGGGITNSRAPNWESQSIAVDEHRICVAYNEFAHHSTQVLMRCTDLWPPGTDGLQ